MENQYINGGIVKEMTLFLKKTADLHLALEKLGKFINLNLYDIKIFDNAVYFELNEEYIKKHLVNFLEEINTIHLPTFIDYKKKITYIRDHLHEDLDHILEYCDDLFIERFRTYDTFSINDNSFHLDILCYVFYFEGPYSTGNFEGLLQYIHLLQRKTLKNPLRDVLCFGISC